MRRVFPHNSLGKPGGEEGTMPNREEHRLTATVMGMTVAAFGARERKPIRAIAEAIGGGVGGRWGGILPDLLEPATSPTHRHFAHSVTIGVGLSAGQRPIGIQLRDLLRSMADKAFEAQEQSQDAFLWWSLYGLVGLFLCFLAGLAVAMVPGYLSHLVLDAGTRRGLPLVA